MSGMLFAATPCWKNKHFCVCDVCLVKGSFGKCERTAAGVILYVHKSNTMYNTVQKYVSSKFLCLEKN